MFEKNINLTTTTKELGVGYYKWYSTVFCPEIKQAELELINEAEILNIVLLYLRLVCVKTNYWYIIKSISWKNEISKDFINLQES